MRRICLRGLKKGYNTKYNKYLCNKNTFYFPLDGSIVLNDNWIGLIENK